ncbi:leucyl/phenylalanyl-tRNA--protein transferase [Aureimonas frigidaquae]|uniref:Leucyl/phenylalanyl-tRNA--protein transferase n=1 Tax=Aureimonas frigidaquae TaxID=424757 RepID=A0A0P0Z305_9HYPH|nr:leucyl/phenylalanyl-tRNA--protein transferase [Aureimonas frigidaquae]BAT28331.1 leucyl/phenylalanyl-tRNA-protein transferase [Aureimonas frigidaquae]
MPGGRGVEPAITPRLLLRAYANGIFPMAQSADDPRIHWIDPTERGILPLSDVHVPRRLARRLRARPYDIRFDTAFPAVVDGCAEPAPGRMDTWINAQIRSLYLDLFRMGHAHSVEAWDGSELVGGLYGVSLGGAFFGESMFSRRTDASKLALLYLCNCLIRSGYQLLDTQFLTAHLVQFGAVEIPRRRYRALLEAALMQDATFNPEPLAEPDGVIASLRQAADQA